MTTGANAAIVAFTLIPNDHQDRAQAIEAVLVDLVVCQKSVGLMRRVGSGS